MPSAQDAADLDVEVDGRTLSVWHSAMRGPVLLFQPGTPAPPVPWPRLDDLAAARGLTLVSYARPGYSGSTRHRGRRVADVALDVAAVLDALDVDEFVTIGHSGGGPHAIACAALLPDRCRAVATIGGVAPADLVGDSWTDGMAEENIAEFAAAEAGEDVLRPHLESELTGYAAVTPDDVARALGGLVTEVDRAALSDDYADMVASCLRRAASDGLDGWVDDDLAFLAPWGVDLGDVVRPVALWQGRHDAMVPYAHGEWLAAHVAHAHPRLHDDEGHLSLVNGRIGEIVDDLVALASTGR